MSRFSLVVVLLAGFSAPVQALTLEDAVLKAVESSHGLKSVSAARDGAKAMADEAGHMRLPVLTYQSSYTYGDDPVYVFGTLLRQKQFTSADFALDKLNSPSARTNFSNSLQLELPLFTGFKISNYRRLGETALQQADSSAVYARQGTALEAMQKYFMASFKGELARIAAETAESTAAELAVADRLKEKGLVLGSDYYAAQALLGSIKTAQASFSREAQASSAALAVLMGGGAADALPPLRRHIYALPEEAAMLEGLSRRGDVASAMLAARSAKIVRDMESDTRLPELGAFARLQTDTQAFAANPLRQMAGVSMNFPFGDFARQDRLARREAEQRQAGESALHLRQSAAAQLAEYRHNYESAAYSLALAEAARADAQRSLELFRPLFRQGRQSVLDVARAEHALMSARAACAELVFKIHSYYAALLFSSGGLEDKAVSELSVAVGGEEK